MPRIRQWQDLIFWRPSPTVRYEHIDALSGTLGRNVIDWDLIETHFKDLMQIAISIPEGAISSAVLLRRLRSGSRRNATYVAFREVGQVIRTVQLLRFLSDGALRGGSPRRPARWRRSTTSASGCSSASTSDAAAWRENLPPSARPGTAPECTATGHALSPQASPPGAAPRARDGRVRVLPQGLRPSPRGPGRRACRAGQGTGPAGRAVARTHNRPRSRAHTVAPMMPGAVTAPARHGRPPLSSLGQCPGREAPSRRPGHAKLCLPVMVPPIVFLTRLPRASASAGKTLPRQHRR